MRNRFPKFAAIVLLLTAAGCRESRPQTWPVRGRVIFRDGEPVRFGIVEFDSLDHQSTARGLINENGEFVLSTFGTEDGAVAGPSRAIVVQLMVFDAAAQHVRDHGALVSPETFSYETSGLSFDVLPNQDNRFTIVVKRRSETELTE